MLHAARQFIKYYLRANTRYRVHSPSLYTFVNDVIETDYPYYCYGKIEGLRSHLLQNHRKIKVDDGISGSISGRMISKIASTLLPSYKRCRLMHRIATYYKPRTILELNTSLGISASYLSYVAPTTTIARNTSIAEVAKSIFDQQDIEVELQVGHLVDSIEDLNQEQRYFDLIYINSNQTTSDSFNHLHSILNQGGIMLYDDIYKSKVRTNLWEKIKGDKRVKRTIDLYHFGIVEIGDRGI